MLVKKKWFTILFAIIAISILAACGSNEGKDDVESQDAGNVQDSSSVDIMPLSDGLEEYDIWLHVELPLTRDSHIRSVYVFDNGEVVRYGISGEDILIEDIHDLPKDEFIKLASETANKLMNEKVSIDNLSYDSVFDKVTSYFEETNLDSYLEAYDINVEFPDDIIINDERPSLSSKYTLDLKIDNLGQDTEEINLEIPDAYYALDGNLDRLKELVRNYAYSFFDAKVGIEELTQSGDKEVVEQLTEDFLRDNEGLISDLEEYGDFKESDGDLPKLSSFVNTPINWIANDETITLRNDMIHQTIFDSTFAGVETDSDTAFITSVEKGFEGFALDTPSVEKDNVTIEGK